MAKNKDERIFISIDPGFDSIKILINGVTLLKFPKEVADISNMQEGNGYQGTQNRFIGVKEDDYMKVQYVEGKTHLVGEYAAKYLAERGDEKSIEESFAISESANDTFSVFQTTEKEILIMTAIAKALIEYAKTAQNLVKLEPQNGYTEVKILTDQIFIGVAMPHDAVDAWNYIEKWMNGTHDYKLETKEGLYHININTRKCMVGSQVISALYGVLTDDIGALNDVALSDDKLPAIVIDGGYLTLGIAHFTTVKLVDGSDSNLKYAMRNIYDNVAKQIREISKRSDVSSVTVKQTMRQKEKKLHYLDGDKKGHTIDVGAMVGDEIRKVCEELIEELRSKYKDLVNTRSIIVTGGTGIAYYEHMKEILSDCDWINVMLTDYEFNGKNITPDFAIVVGMYKVLHAAVDAKYAA